MVMEIMLLEEEKKLIQNVYWQLLWCIKFDMDDIDCKNICMVYELVVEVYVV